MLDEPLSGSRYVHARDGRGWTALTHAAKEGRALVAESLLEEGADVNARSGAWTPLLAAAQQGRVEVVELLLERGASPAEARRVWALLLRAGPDLGFGFPRPTDPDPNIPDHDLERIIDLLDEAGWASDR